MPEATTESAAPATEHAGIFATTRWTLVAAAGGDDVMAREALEVLCGAYWFPVYTLVRRRGFDAELARDFTQEFFAQLLSRDGFSSARQARGRFRAFLSQAVKNFLADQWDKISALKRGGGKAVLSLDAEAAEGRYFEIPDDASPDKLFDRQWAADLLENARRLLAEEYAAAGKEAVLAVFERMASPDAPTMEAEAARMGIPANTLKSHLRRARLRHAEIVRELVADTVESPAQVDDELRHLMEALG
jgi:DNA-directed RNA polymerase specialized sigma24 family protein